MAAIAANLEIGTLFRIFLKPFLSRFSLYLCGGDVAASDAPFKTQTNCKPRLSTTTVRLHIKSSRAREGDTQNTRNNDNKDVDCKLNKVGPEKGDT
jgi:hypothetical protein